jgi:glycosyltransferase involved in cell wall biosynthesis
MSRIVLVQPRPAERLSGGYLYNARMAAHGAWEIVSVDREELEHGLSSIGDGLVIADSIWLAEATMAPFLALRERDIRLAVMMHSFPSMIAAAESGQTVRSRPTTFELEMLQRVDLVVLPGPHYGDMLRQHGVKVAICEPGIDHAWRVLPRPRRGACTLVSVGAVTARKGFRDVLEAMRQEGRQAELHWTVIGSLEVDPRYAEGICALATEFPGVSLIGQKHPDEVRERVIASDVLVMPSYDENHPLVLLEAMAASVPAVTYEAGAAAHILGAGTRGLSGPIGNRATLARNLTRLMDDESERYRMAEACWQWQRHLPSWATAAARAQSALKRIDP